MTIDPPSKKLALVSPLPGPITPDGNGGPRSPAPGGRRRGIRAGQVIGVEHPAIRVLVPVTLSSPLRWWSPDDVLVWGVSAPKLRDIGDGRHDWKAHPKVSNTIGFYPMPIPNNWYGQEIGCKVSYMAEAGAQFQLRFLYACGDETSLQTIASDKMSTPAVEGAQAGVISFDLDERKICRNSIFASTLQLIRRSNHQVVLRSIWLELGVDRTTNKVAE